MRIRTVGLLGIAALAMVLVGCAHSSGTAHRISFLPDSFDQPTTTRKADRTAQVAKKVVRPEIKATTTSGRLSLGATGMLTEAGDGKLARNRPSSQRSKSTRNGKKKDPSQLNVPMLIKMGGFAKLYGAADETEKDSGNVTRTPDSNKRSKKSDFITMANRASRLTVKKKRPPMLNMNMLIKGGFYARMSRLALEKRRKFGPGMLNMNMLIKMGGFARGLEKDTAYRPNRRHVAQQLRSNAMYQRKQRVRRATQEFKMRFRTNGSKAFRRQQLGGRCWGSHCD